MPSTSSSSGRNVRPSSTQTKANRKTPAIGALVGAVVGGVLGAVLVRKVRAAGGAKRLLPAQVPVAGKRALSVVKSVADEAVTAAKSAGEKAAGHAMTEVKTAAEQFVVGVMSGRPTARTTAAEPAVERAESAPVEAASVARAQRKKSSASSKTSKSGGAKTKSRPSSKTTAAPKRT